MSGAELSAEWNLVIRCHRSPLALVSLHGSQSAMEARARLAMTWGDVVEFLGPKVNLKVTEAKPEALTRLKDHVTRRNDTFRDFQ
jgi:hypothetical protein